MAKAKPVQATRKKIKQPFIEKKTHYPVSPRLRESLFILSLAIGGLLFAALLAFQTAFLGSFGGVIGHFIAQQLFDFFGLTAYVLPLGIIYAGWVFFRTNIILPAYDYKKTAWRFLGCILSLI